MNDHSPQANLDWLAFQYVTHALCESECEEFERQMLDSQDCREAVARAVELALAAEYGCRPCEAASVELAKSSGLRSRRIRRWIWSAVAASVAFLVGWQASLWCLGGDAAPHPGGSDVAESASESRGVVGRELAMAWEQTRRTLLIADLDHDHNSLTAHADAEAVDEAPALAVDVEAPSWMLAAVAGMQGIGRSESPEEGARPVSEAPTSSDAREEG